MRPLIKTNSILFIYIALPLTVFFTLIWFTASVEGESDFTYIFLYHLGMAAIIFVGTGEHIEDKDQGYKFLQTLPVTDADIVASKFLLTLIMVVYFGCLEFVLLLFTKGSPFQLKAIAFFLPLVGMASLILAGLLFICVFKFGYSRMNKVSWIVVIVMCLSLWLVLPKIKSHLVEIINFFIHMGWTFQLPAAVITLYCYYLMMKKAVKVKIAARG